MDQELFDQVYETVKTKSSTYDGVYYTCVKTTKIVCRPSCRARTPYKQNIVFMTSVEAAVQAGYRPCKRCRPEIAGQKNPDQHMVAQVNELLERDIRSAVGLQKLAAELSISPYHLQRVYKRVTGYSPAEYLLKLRLSEAQTRLELGSDPVSSIAEAVGFRSASHFSAWFGREVGMTPSQYRDQHTLNLEQGRRGID